MFTEDLINKFQSTPTPFYYYDTDLLRKTLDALQKASKKHDIEVHYALKANSNKQILNIISKLGIGADCVSGNEIRRAIESGFPANKIVFAGVGKSDDEIRHALKEKIFCFNCESVEEIKVIEHICKSEHTKANIALRINPNVNAHTHHYITTGLEENKFGINMWDMENVLEAIKHCKHITLIGLHFHIGSQITDMTVFKTLCMKVNELQQWFFDRNIYAPNINLGGGLGIDYYHPDDNSIVDFETYFSIFRQFLKLHPGQKLHVEPGRALVAQCGSLVSKVLFVKKGIQSNFIILDAGMTELIRPALYQSYHKIENITSSAVNTLKYDVTGPVCESSDCFGKAIDLPETQRGDLIVLRSAGAYGESMALDYNLRDRAKSYLSEEL
ncbi:MAG TPA: diaminopimelate decarboxylase [Bacteroidia bacterium]|jgi:diaminopimelate decarboxylase|nr:diaminopimelate decarboxylase [Bacteroidia bacterium]